MTRIAQASVPARASRRPILFLGIAALLSRYLAHASGIEMYSQDRLIDQFRFLQEQQGTDFEELNKLLETAVIRLPDTEMTGKAGMTLNAYNTRFLQEQQGTDFEELNKLLETAVIRLPDTEMTGKAGMTLTAYNFFCTNISVNDIKVDHFNSFISSSTQGTTVTFRVVGLSMTCTTDFHFKALLGWLVNGSGSADLYSYNNEASTTMSFVSKSSGDESHKVVASVDTCDAIISIDNMDFDGRFLASILDAIERLLRGRVESEVSRVVCEYMTSLRIQDLVDLVADLLEPYRPSSNEEVDPLASEQALVVPENTLLLNLLNWEEGTRIARLMHLALDKAVSYLGAPTAQDATELNLNVLVRDYLSNDAGLVVEVEDMPFFRDSGGVIYSGHDQLTETTVTLKRIKLIGLDSFTKFEPLVSIGQYTLESNLSWKTLAFELDMTFDIKPSTREDSFIADPSASRVVEQVKVQLGVEDVDAAFSLLLAMDEEALGELQFGSLLRMENLVPCVLSTMIGLELSTLSVEVVNVRAPTVQGFVSPGLDRVVSGAVDAAFDIYRGVLLESVPIFFQTTIRELLNKNILKKYRENGSADCPAWSNGVPAATALEASSGETSFVDYRDLLLSPDDARAAGGSGTEPYGNLASTLVDMFHDELLHTNANDGLPKINSVLRPVTQSQSGVEGELQFPSELFSLSTDMDASWSTLLERVEVMAHNSSLENVDTITSPLFLLDPTGAYRLSNRINVGPVSSRPLTGTTKLLLAFVAGEYSPLNMRNEVEVRVSIPSSNLWADVFATMDERALLEFPLKAIENYYCWLATIPASDANIARRRAANQKSLALTKLKMSMSSLSFDVRCTSCTSLGGDALPEIMNVLEQAGLFSLLKQRFEKHFEELAWNFWHQLQMEHSEAPLLCPQSPYFKEGAVAKSREAGRRPHEFDISRAAVETMAVLGALVTDIAMIVTAKSHLLLPATETPNPLSGQETMIVPPDARLVDFTDLGGSFGSWGETFFDKVREYAGNVGNSQTTGDEEDNSSIAFIRSLILGEDGMFTYDFGNATFEWSGMKAELSKVRIGGMDTLSRANILDPIAAQTLQNEFAFDRLGMMIDMGIVLNSGNDTTQDRTEKMTFSIGVDDVDIRVAAMLAMDLDELGNIELGAFFETANIFPCVLSRVYDASVPLLSVTAGNFDDPLLEGFIPSDLRDTSASSVNALFNEFRPDLIAAVPAIFQTTLRETLNGILRIYREENTGHCNVSTPIADSGVIDFRDLFLSEAVSRDLGGSGESPYGDLFRAAYDLMNQQLLTTEINGSSINDVLRHWTESQSNITGTYLHRGDLLNTTNVLSLAGFQADLEFRVSDLRVDNLDSLFSLDLLQPVMGEGSVLNNTVSLGGGTKPLRFSAKFFIAIDDNVDVDIRNGLDIMLEFKDLSLFLRVLLELSEGALARFPLRDVTNLACWLSLVSPPTLGPDESATGRSGAALIRHAVSVGDVAFNVSCLSCTSPDFDDLIMKLYSPVLQEGLEQADRLLRSDFLQSVIDSFLLDASRKCPHSPEYGSDTSGSGSLFVTSRGTFTFERTARDSKSMLFHIANACLLALLILIAIMIRMVVRRRHLAWIASLSKEDAFNLRRLEAKEQAKEERLNEMTDSLFRSQHLPRRIRYFTPFLLLGTIGLYLGAHFGILSTVDVDAQVAGQEMTAYGFLKFSFVSATVDTFHNGGHELAVFLFIFNGFWPYLKLCALMVLWFLPPKKLSVSKRGKALLWIDVLVKLSVVDMFTILVAIGAILIFVGGPDESLANEVEYFGMKALVFLQGGFYCLLIGQRLSRSASRFILDHHNRVVEMACREYEQLYSLDRTNTSECTEDSEMHLSEKTPEGQRHVSEASDGPVEIFEDDSSTGTGSESNRTCPQERDEEQGGGRDMAHGDHVEELYNEKQLTVSFGSADDDCSEPSCRDKHDGSKDEQNYLESRNNQVMQNNENDNSFDATDVLLDGHRVRQMAGISNDAAGTALGPSDDSDTDEFVDEYGSIESQSTDGAQHDGSEHDDTDGPNEFMVPDAPETSEVDSVPAYPSKQRQQHNSVKSRSERLRGRLGVIGAILAGVTAIILLIIGLVLAPAISLDTKSVWAIAMESGKSYQQAVTDYSVFRVIATILLQARFVLSSLQDYVGLGILIALAIVAGVLVPLIQGVLYLRRRFGRRTGQRVASSLPAYIKSFQACQHMEIYVLAFVFACWQFSAIALYCIHYYCYILELIYSFLVYLGVMEYTNAQCFRTQASLPSTVLVLVSGFLALLCSFLIQLAAQYRRNVAHAAKLTEDDVWI